MTIKILLIDDDKSLWSLIKRSLKKHSFEVFSADSIEEARDTLDSERYDLYIMDYNLPDGCGLTLLIEQALNVPCILLTGQGDESIAVQAMKGGAADYVVKDINGSFLNLLPSVIHRTLEKANLMTQLSYTRQRMHKVFNEAPELMVVSTNEYMIIEANLCATEKYNNLLQNNQLLLTLMSCEQLLALSQNKNITKELQVCHENVQLYFEVSCRRLGENELLFIFKDVTAEHIFEITKKELADINVEKNDLIIQNKVLASRNNIEASLIIGQHASISALKRTITNVADTSTNVLIEGETGTGKELVACEIHWQSQRKAMQMVKINCGAIPENLVESELFGHAKGSFTGAIKDHKGRFEQAHNSTLFLDEVGELNLSVQVKLLRVLQEGIVEPIGSNKQIKVDVRIIAATNRDLGEMVREGQFRSDLFYRLNVIPLCVPPLRKRKDDIPLLINYFLHHFKEVYSREVPPISQEQMQLLLSQDWLGNIRELRNTIERMIVLGTITEVPQNMLIQKDSDKQFTPEVITTDFLSLEEIEKNYIEKVLKSCNWQIAGEKGAAKILKLNPSTLRFKIKKLNVIR